jgi:hypothetical protein
MANESHPSIFHPKHENRSVSPTRAETISIRSI